MQNRIVVPLDGSAAAEIALTYAEPIARVLGWHLTLLQVSERSGARLRPTAPDLARQRRKARERRAYLTRLGAELTSRGVPTGHKVLAGTPAEVIARASRRSDVAMIAMATHGRSALERLVLGSVADVLVRTTTVPLLLLRPPLDAAPPLTDAERRLHRLLVPLDGSPLAEAAVPFACDLARALHAELDLVQVVPIPIGARATPPLPEPVQAAKRYLQGVWTRLAGGVSGETIVVEGEVEDLVLYFTHAAADLMVMTTRGRSGWRRMVLGSVAELMLRSGVPTVLVPARQRPRESGTLREPALSVGRDSELAGAVRG